MSSELPELSKVEVLSLEPHDVLLISSPQRITQDTADAIKDKVVTATGVEREKVLILSSGMSLHVLRREEIAPMVIADAAIHSRHISVTQEGIKLRQQDGRTLHIPADGSPAHWTLSAVRPSEDLEADPPELRCSACGRRSEDLALRGHPCRMRQPDGSTCEGTMWEAQP